MDLTAIKPWMVTVGGMVFFVLALSLAKVPPPKDPRWRAIWNILMRLTVFAWNEWGFTKFKWLGTIEPDPDNWDNNEGKDNDANPLRMQTR